METYISNFIKSIIRFPAWQMIARASVFFFLLFLESHTETGSFEKEDGRIRRLLSSFSEIILYHLEEKKKLCNVTYKRERKRDDGRNQDRKQFVRYCTTLLWVCEGISVDVIAWEDLFIEGQKIKKEVQPRISKPWKSGRTKEASPWHPLLERWIDRLLVRNQQNSTTKKRSKPQLFEGFFHASFLVPFFHWLDSSFPSLLLESLERSKMFNVAQQKQLAFLQGGPRFLIFFF